MDMDTRMKLAALIQRDMEQLREKAEGAPMPPPPPPANPCLCLLLLPCSALHTQAFCRRPTAQPAVHAQLPTAAQARA